MIPAYLTFAACVYAAWAVARWWVRQLPGLQAPAAEQVTPGELAAIQHREARADIAADLTAIRALDGAALTRELTR